MEKVETISSIRGKKFLHEIFYKLKYEQQISGLLTLFICWKICVFEREVSKYINMDLLISHPLGLFKGTHTWLEEILNRYYMSTISSFVYLGAAILLALVGMRRFSDKISDEIIMYSILLESSLLIMMFFVMFFSSKDEYLEPDNKSDDEEIKEELITEIGEIAREFATAVSRLEKIDDSFSQVSKSQNELIKTVSALAAQMSDNSNPNPKLLEYLTSTNKELKNFSEAVAKLNKSLDKVKSKEIKSEIRSELEKLLLTRIKD